MPALTSPQTKGSQPSPLRGEIAQTALMETLQVGYLHAVAAAAGCSLSKPSPDVSGTDWHLDHPSHAHVTDPTQPLRVQLKCTSQVTPSRLVGASDFPMTLRNEHLAHLAASPVTICRILVVMIAPGNIGDWLSASADALALRHCCYWANLEGVRITGQTRTTVRVPVNNVFDDVALCDIMRLRGQGVTPR